MTNEEMRAGLIKAYELLAYGQPDSDLTNATSSAKWVEECDAWLDTFPPSKVSAAVEPEARLTDMTFKAHEGESFEATAQFQGDAVKMWALAMVQWFREKGGINYVTCDLRDPTNGEAYEITMQKAGGRTPAQDLAEMRAQLNR